MYLTRSIFRSKVTSWSREFSQPRHQSFTSTMAEHEERPSKIRKLDSTADLTESPLSFATRQDASATSISEAPNGQDISLKDDPLGDVRVKSEEEPKLTKSAMKKLRRAEQWEAGKEDRKIKRREKHKEKQARKAEHRAELQAQIASGEPVDLSDLAPKQDRPPFRRPAQVPVSLILDCDFNDLMTPKELISLAAQLTRCYSENKSSPFRSHLALSSFGGTLKSRFENVLSSNHLGWKGVKFYEEDFEGAAEKMDEIMRSRAGGRLLGAFAKDTENAMETKNSTQNPVPVVYESKKSSGSVQIDVHEVSQSTNSGKSTGPESSVPSTTISSSEVPQSAQNSEGAEAKLEQVELEEVKLEDIKSEDIKSEETEFKFTVPRAPASIVYLTSDSPHTLEYLEPNTSYIIGGIVDKNRHKGLCYKRACERGIRTAKLPIGEYMTMQSRTVLAINHVVEIMLKWLVTEDWGEAFLSVIPKRKEARLKVRKSENDQGEESSPGDYYQGEDEEMEDVEEGDAGGASLVDDAAKDIENFKPAEGKRSLGNEEHLREAITAGDSSSKHAPDSAIS